MSSLRRYPVSCGEMLSLVFWLSPDTTQDDENEYETDEDACTVTAIVRGGRFTMRLWSDGTWHEDMLGERVDDDYLPRYVRKFGPEPLEIARLRENIVRVLSFLGQSSSSQEQDRSAA